MGPVRGRATAHRGWRSRHQGEGRRGPDPLGSSTLTSELLEHGLADEVLLLVYPVLLGKGKRFFAEGTPPRALALDSTNALSSGVLVNTYKAAGPLQNQREGASQMRFMMMVIPKGYESAAPDTVPRAEAVAKMMEYNKALQKAGVLLALDGLLPPSTGAHISFANGKATVTDGPLAEAKEVVGGYWIIQVRSREEAIEWAKRAPMENNCTVEVRQIQEMSDFPSDVQDAAASFEDIQKAAASKP